MKKFLFIFLFLLIIPFKVDALTYNRCGESIEVDSSNFIYYYYDKFPDYFSTYNYFMGIRLTNGSYYMFFTNRSDNVTFQYASNNFRVYPSLPIYYFINGESTQRIVSNSTGSLALRGFTATSPYFTNHNYGRNGELPSNFDIATLEEYFTCASPPHFETKNEVFTSFISQLVDLIPYIIVFIIIFEGVGYFINKKD